MKLKLPFGSVSTILRSQDSDPFPVSSPPTFTLSLSACTPRSTNSVGLISYQIIQSHPQLTRNGASPTLQAFSFQTCNHFISFLPFFLPSYYLLCRGRAWSLVLEDQTVNSCEFVLFTSWAPDFCERNDRQSKFQMRFGQWVVLSASFRRGRLWGLYCSFNWTNNIILSAT